MASLRVLPAGGPLVHRTPAHCAPSPSVGMTLQTKPLPACTQTTQLHPLRCQHTSPSSSAATPTPQRANVSDPSPPPQRFYGSLFNQSSPHAKQSTAPSSPTPASFANGVVTDTDAASNPLGTLSAYARLFLDAVRKYWKPALACLIISAFLWFTSGDALAAKGGGRAGGKSFSSSRARSYSAPKQSYSAPRSGYSGGSSFSAPFFFAPSPFIAPTFVVGGGGGGGFLSFIFFSLMAIFILNAVLSLLGGSQADEDVWSGEPRTSIVRLQVGLMGTARQLQKDLERMATRADTSTPEGLHYLLQEAVLSLLRNPDYCIYGYSTSEVAKDSYEGEQVFNRLSLEERSKFKEETLVNVGDVRKRIERTRAGESVGSEYIVVTIIAASEGSLRLPEIKSAVDLRSALTHLGSITTDDLQAVEILWTPENEEDTLTTKDMLHDYPLLRPL